MKEYVKKHSNKFILLGIFVLFFIMLGILSRTTFTEKTTSSIWDGSIATKFSKGNGSPSDPYIINDGSELALLFSKLNSNEYADYFNKHYRLENNIDLNELSLPVIETSFHGNFNGNGYSLLNIKIDTPYIDGPNAYYSLFGKLDGANIHDLNLVTPTTDLGNGDLYRNIKEENATVEENETDENTSIEEPKKEENKEEQKVEEKAETKIEEKKDDVLEGNKTEEKSDDLENTNVEENVSDENTTVEEPKKEESKEETKEEPKTEDKNETVVPKEDENKTEEVKPVLENTTTIETEENVTTEEEEEATVPVENVYVGLFGDVKDSIISNVSISSAAIVGNKNSEYNYKTSLFVVNDIEDNTFKNINIRGFSELEDTVNFVYDYNDADVSNVMYYKNNLAFTKESKNFDKVYEYFEKNEKIVFTDNYSLKSVLEVFNSDSGFEWTIANNIFRIKNNGTDGNEEPPRRLKMMSLRAAPSAHASGVSGDYVYVNDYEADANYFGGKNYTYSANGALPSLADKNIYKESNLVYVQANYFGQDKDGNFTGTVSNTETEKNFVYYKVYEVNNNGTANNTNDDYVRIPLIDNPYARRPNDRVFNGWITDNPNVTIEIDMDTYIRYARIPVTYTSGNPTNINVNFYAVWSVGKVVLKGNSSWANVFDDLDDQGMVSTVTSVPVYSSYNGILYLRGTVNNRQAYPAGAVDQYGDPLTGTCRANNGWGGGTCTYYYAYNTTTPVTPEPGNTYYYLPTTGYYPTMTTYTITIDHYENVYDIPVGDSVAGYFEYTHLANGARLNGYYNASGQIQTSGTCGNNNCWYYEFIPYYDGSNNANVAVAGTTYYYLATRDTNVVVLNQDTGNIWSSSEDKPLTVTGINNGNNYTTAEWEYTGTFNIYADTRIEFVQIYNSSTASDSEVSSSGTRALYGNFYNLKVGRGLVRYSSTEYDWWSGNNVTNNYTSFNQAYGGGTGGTGSSGSPTNYTFIIESGLYNLLGATASGSASTSTNMYVHAKVTYGSDYDRVKNDNSKLTIQYCAAGFWGARIRSENTTTIGISTTIKSGEFGANKADYASGVYVGGRGSSNAQVHCPNEVIQEGGWIYNLIGGPLTQSGNKSLNQTYMYIKGGTVDIVVGGAGLSTTYGNRVIQITGGTVNYAVFGGSNGVTGSNGDGTLDGDTYIYIGGNAFIGNETLVDENATESTSQVEAGSVFGIGNGRNGDNYTSIGTCNNSNVIIDGGATVRNNVYGGGNYGAAGTAGSSSSYQTHIEIHNGATINGNVYGGGNNNGAGSTSKSNAITINMDGGDVDGSIYGGSRTKGTVYGSTTVNITNGNIDTDVYGGGEGANTFVRDNVAVTIGNSSTGPTIGGNVYGGSAYGTVNATSANAAAATSKSTTVTVNKGNITGNVFGGAKGDSSNTPYVNGNITVNINGGTMSKVFGGFDAAGTPKAGDVVYLNGGTIGDAFGGGNNTGQTTTDIRLQGATVTNVFGGSNQSGNVTTSNVTVSSGSATNIYGGNNSGGTTATSNVTTTGGTASNVFGGGYSATTTTSHVNINGGTFTTAYGGGDLASVGTTNITLNGGNVTTTYGGGNQAGATTTNVIANSGGHSNTIYGGSNQSGDVTTANVTFNGGNSNAVYGGNNSGGLTATANVTVNNGTIVDVYGGGNLTGTTTTNVDINNGNITNAYGGGNQGVVTTTNIRVDGGTIASVFGGGNQAIATTTHVDLYGGTVTDTYGGGNQAGTSETNVVAHTGSSSTNVYGGSNQSGNNTTTNVTIDDGTFTSIYGGSNQGGNNATTNVTINSGTMTSVYGGNNRGGTSTTTNVTINGSNISEVYGGGNLAPVGTSNVNVTSGTVTTAYGGGNQANTTATNVSISGGNTTTFYGGGNQGTVGTTNVDMTNGTVTTLYGGGNLATVGTTDVDMTNGTVGTLYGGGNQAGVNSTDVAIKGGTVTSNVFGGGNQGVVTGSTNVLINDANINGSAYAGGNGSSAVVSGNTTITVGGDTVIGTSSCTLPSTCSLFGGGNAAETGTAATNNSVATVNLAGGTIHGNVYGGANTSVVHGGTVLNIGADSPTPTGIERDDILVKGTVFGGGEANASGSTTYDYSFISVTGSIVVNINGQNYNNLDVKGSVFGSGNASSSMGTSEINIYNYGTADAPKDNISVQRTGTLTIDNSAIRLEGTTDRTNEYSNVEFSLSRIDVLNLQNNSTIYLRNGTNLLKQFNSLTADGQKAAVTINDTTKTVTKNVDNRLYVYQGVNVNIASQEGVNIAGGYGPVNGMTFFGMYMVNEHDDGVITGIYGNYGYGDVVTWNAAFTKGSYVLGEHKSNHNIEVDGFYSNYVDAVTGVNTIKYVETTPPDSDYYIWQIGDSVREYTIELVASKYSTLSAIEVPFSDFAAANTSFTILGVDYTGLEAGINLIDKNSIPKVAATTNDADANFGLAIEASEAGWLTTGSTNFYTDPNNQMSGTTNYVGDSTNNVPTLLFYLYHSKNFGTTADMGRASINLVAITKIDDLNSEVQRFIINVDMSRVLFTDNNYEGALTTGRKYELFSSTATNISAKSSISAYFSLYVEGQNVYRPGYKRALVSNYALPENTKITMIDISGDNPKYYYHIITAAEEAAAASAIQTDTEASYPLSMFEVMGAFNSGSYYDDAAMNTAYYNATGNYDYEEFIFIVDFADTNIDTTSLQNSLLFELQNATGEAIIGVLGIQHANMMYNIYADREAIIDLEGTISKNDIYAGETVLLNINTNYTQYQNAGIITYDTSHIGDKLGLEISILDSNGNIVPGTSMMGLYYDIDGNRYFPNVDGTTRVKIADKVGNVETWIRLATGTSNLSTGDYTIRIASFASPDGLYYGIDTSDTLDFPVHIINEIYGLKVTTIPENLLIDGATGLSLMNTNVSVFNVEYNSGLTNPSVHVRLSRRKYDEIYDTNYEVVNLYDYISNIGEARADGNYVMLSNPQATNTITFEYKPNLLNGTYKVEFMLYDSNSLIGTVEKYVIIK